MATKQDLALALSLRNLVTNMNRRLRKQISNPEQLSIPELNVLSILMTQPEVFPSELCAQLNISSQYMSQVLNHLHELTFIARTPSVQDKRKTLITLTKKGRAKVEHSRQEREEWLAIKISENYNNEQKTLIKEALALLSALSDN
jgi:DNA-binding MarR family transcriptional regulator